MPEHYEYGHHDGTKQDHIHAYGDKFNEPNEHDTMSNHGD